MRYPVKVDHSTHKIVMSCKFAKEAQFPDTDEFRELQTLCASFPTYTVNKRTIKLNSQKEAFNGLTYAYMEEYIPKHENAEINMQKYLKMQELARCHSIRYSHIKKWFLETYPEVKEFKLYQKANGDENVSA